MKPSAWAVVFILLLATLLRIWAATDNFWLDEIFTYYLAIELDSAWDALFKVRTEHHILNTMYMHLVGDQANWGWYRLFSVFTGCGAIALIMRMGFQRSTADGLVSGWLAGISLPMIQYASEARGYAGGMFFALASVLFLQRYWSRRTWGPLIGFWITTLLAILAHLTAVYVFAALGVWSVIRESRNAGRKKALPELIKCHAFPAASFVCLYVFVVLPSTSIGGDVLTFSHVMSKTLCMATGVPHHGGWIAIGVVGACMVMVAGLSLLPRDEPGLRSFYLCTILLVPALVLLVSSREYLYMRYFVICFPFFYLLVGRIMAYLFDGHRLVQLAGAILLLAMTIGNVYASLPLLRSGRGQYTTALAYMAAATDGTEIVIGSDHDFRNKITLQYYSHLLPEEKRLTYVNFDAWPEQGPEWVIAHSGDPNNEPKPHLDTKGGSYSLVQHFPFGGLSGFHWYLYHNDRL